MIAPVLVFVYNRPEHTRRTIESLSHNLLAGASELFIYSDAAKDASAAEAVNAVRSYLKTITDFKSVTIIERDKNWGLAASIIDGVTNIVNQFGKVIVLEDDILTSPYFLSFMNDALDFYENKKKVWHISGYMYPIKKSHLPETFFSKNENCWGWATWKDRWQNFEKNPDALLAAFTPKMKKEFNLDNSCNFFRQIELNKNGISNTWAIFWEATIFLHEGLCINPRDSFTQNIGNDGSGVNCGKSNKYDTPFNIKYPVLFETNINESILGRKKLMKYFKFENKSFIISVLRQLKKTFVRT
jgi:hypothetical protein